MVDYMAMGFAQRIKTQELLSKNKKPVYKLPKFYNENQKQTNSLGN